MPVSDLEPKNYTLSLQLVEEKSGRLRLFDQPKEVDFFCYICSFDNSFFGVSDILSMGGAGQLSMGNPAGLPGAGISRLQPYPSTQCSDLDQHHAPAWIKGRFRDAFPCDHHLSAGKAPAGYSLVFVVAGRDL